MFTSLIMITFDESTKSRCFFNPHFKKKLINLINSSNGNLTSLLYFNKMVFGLITLLFRNSYGLKYAWANPFRFFDPKDARFNHFTFFKNF